MSTILGAEAFQQMQAADPAQMLGLVSAAARRARQHWDYGLAHPLPIERLADIQQVLICGMGGSGSTGDLLVSLCSDSHLPLRVNKSGQLPAWVDRHTLVIGVSYSGNTAETLACLTQAQQQGALLHLLSAGGEVADFAAAHQLSRVPLDGGLPPRSALFDMFFALLGSLQKLRALHLPATADTLGALSQLDQLSAAWTARPDEKAPAPLQLARQLVGLQPIIWGVSQESEWVALRWKNQLAENAKTLALWSVLPELNHNEMVAICAAHHSRQALIYLNLETATPVADSIALALAADHLAAVEQLSAAGSTRLERLLYLTYFGDFMSVYLALLQGIDPTPIEAIEQFKARLAQAQA
ncbi:MAG: hypothetical protein IGS03_04855 [Candidatus Sericytochromatia bacterium]|nr:hypothetical protein [Candidatus Sericytochromatia bacterium]